MSRTVLPQSAVVLTALMAACLMQRAETELPEEMESPSSAPVATTTDAPAPVIAEVQAQQAPAGETAKGRATVAARLSPADDADESGTKSEADALAVSEERAKDRRARKDTSAPMPSTIAAGPMPGKSAGGGGAPYAPIGGELASSPAPEPVVTGSTSEDYTDYGVNPFTMVADDPQSTFSIDVDTASYTISRRKLQEGSLPSFAAVRVEEYVNYFDYDYVAPQNDPFAVNMEAMPDPFRPGHHLLRIGVQGREVSRDERPPLHLTFLVDVSGSMSSPDKLPLAKQSLHKLVDTLREDDTVALATYAGRVACILEPTSAGDTRRVHEAIEGLSSGGSTAMSAGIDIAYDLARKSFREGHENRVLILSDGDANVGRTSWDDMLSQIKGHADDGVTLSTIGFGMGNYKDTLMEQLANKGDGNNFYIDSEDQAQRVFVEKIGGTLVTIARDTKIQVEFNPASVRAYRLIGYENRDIADKDFRNDRVDAGEVGAGHSVTALYDVILKDGYSRELAKVRMRYEKPGADGTATEKAWTFQDRALKETPWLASRDTRIAYSAATFAEILRESPNAAEISLDELTRFAEKSRRSGEKDDDELISLMRKAASLGAGRGGGLTVSR